MGESNREKSKASWQLRAALKRRTQKWRRRQVIGLYLIWLIVTPMQLGEDHHGFHHLFWAVYPILIAWGAGTRWFQAQRRIVTSLDDRAQVSHGVNFDQLSAEEQKQLLRKYRMGRYVLDVDWVSDERQQAARLQAKDKAYRLLKVALPWFLAVYWALYLWVPAGDLRTALMDSPMMISWLAVLIVTLPNAIEMWTEPDEIGEPRAISGPGQARQTLFII
jgi:hypothetical protein